MELPTISYEEALEKELEYKNKLAMIRLNGPNHSIFMNSDEPILPEPRSNPIFLTQTQIQINSQSQSQTNFHCQTQNQTNYHSQTLDQTNSHSQIQTNFHSQNQTPIQIPTRNQTNYHFQSQSEPRSDPFNGHTQQQQQPNNISHRPSRRRHVSPRNSLTPYTQMQLARPVQTLSYWCKLCKIDCTTEYNFQAHIGGRKHQANKRAILQGNKRVSGTGESSANRNRNQNGNRNNVSESESVKDVESSMTSVGVIDLTNDE